MRETRRIKAAPHCPGSVVIDVGLQVRCNHLMMTMKAEPKWTKQIKTALIGRLNSYIRHVSFVHAFLGLTFSHFSDVEAPAACSAETPWLQLTLADPNWSPDSFSEFAHNRLRHHLVCPPLRQNALRRRERQNDSE